MAASLPIIDYQSELESNAQNQRLAQMLQQQALQAPGTQMMGPIAIRQSPLQGLARMLTAANYGAQQRGMEEQRRKLFIDRQQGFQNAADELASNIAGSPAQPANTDINKSAQSLDSFDGNPAKAAVAPMDLGAALSKFGVATGNPQAGIPYIMQQAEQKAFLNTLPPDNAPQAFQQGAAPGANGVNPQVLGAFTGGDLPAPAGSQAPTAPNVYPGTGVPVSTIKAIMSADRQGWQAKLGQMIADSAKPQIGRGDGLYVPDGKGGFMLAPGYASGVSQMEQTRAQFKPGSVQKFGATGVPVQGTLLQELQSMSGAGNPYMGGTTPAGIAAANPGAAVKIAGPAGLASIEPAPNAAPAGTAPAAPAERQSDQQAKYGDLSVANFTKAEDALNNSVAQGAQLKNNQNLAKQMATVFQSGGGAEIRSKLAQAAQAVPGMPSSVVDALANAAPNSPGALAAMQTFNKLSAEQAMEALKEAMNNGRITQSEYKIWLDRLPNMSTDPKAINELFNYTDKVYQSNREQQDFMQQYKQSGKPLGGFAQAWAQRRQQQLETPAASPLQTPSKVVNFSDLQ